MKENLIGKKFSNLTIIKEVEHSTDKHRQVLCRCECGNSQIFLLSHLKHGKRTQCKECSYKEASSRNKTHGMKGTRIYRIWQGMKHRCSAKTGRDSVNYHNRGISICQEWKDNFCSFYDWAMKNGYNELLTIDRIDNNGNYCPENCRWVTMAAQQKNKRNNVFLDFNGERKTASEVAKKIGISAGALLLRIKRHGIDDNRIYQKQWRGKWANQYTILI